MEASVVFVLLRTVSIATVVLLLFHVLRRKYIESKFKLPGLKPSLWNPLGVELTLWQMLRRSGKRDGEVTLDFFNDICAQFKGHHLFTAWLAHVPLLVVANADAMEFILSSTTIIEKSRFYELLHKWLGTGLLTSGGPKWRHRRKLLTPAFHFRILDDFLEVFNDQAIIMANKLKLRSKTGEKFDVTKDVVSCTLDIICETAMGVRIGAQTNPESDYVKALYAVGESLIERIFTPLYWNDWAFKLSTPGGKFFSCIETMQKFTMKVIQERKSEMEKSSHTAEEDDSEIGLKVRRPFLNLLLERHLNHGDLSLEDIKEEVDTFMFEGHDTTAVGISWALYLLAENPEAQRKVQAELDEIFSGDTERRVTNEDLARMKYLECCIKEAQRLYPSVPYIGRKFKEDTVHRKSIIPGGTQAVILIYMLHRDEKYFPDPERFDPDRFLPENCKDRHPYAYVPFSAGQRNCIGQKFAMMEEKVVLSWVLRKVSLETSVIREKIRVSAELVTRSMDGLELSAKPR